MRKWLIDSSDNFYKEMYKEYDASLKWPLDTLKRIKFHQIFYLEDNNLKTYVVAAAPEYPILHPTEFILLMRSNLLAVLIQTLNLTIKKR